ncbi:MAG: transcription termination/antitermination protein NusG [Gemmataceae bacterium]
MPILQAEPTVYPDDLLAQPQPPDYPDARWHVLHTKPRQEKSLARDLLDRAVPFYLPVIGHRRSIRGRVMTSLIPLFDGYLFLYSNTDAYHAALSTRRVVRALPVNDQARLAADLRQLHGLIASGLPLTPEPCLLPGQPVEIATGPLAGFRGRVVRAASGRRFVVEVDFIGRGASVVCDGMTLRPLAPAVP